MTTSPALTMKDGRQAGTPLSTLPYRVALGRVLLMRVPNSVPEHVIATLLSVGADLDALVELDTHGYRRAPVHISRKVHEASKVAMASFGDRDLTWPQPTHVLLTNNRGRAYCIAEIVDTARYGPAVYEWLEVGTELQFDAQVTIPWPLARSSDTN